MATMLERFQLTKEWFMENYKYYTREDDKRTLTEFIASGFAKGSLAYCLPALALERSVSVPLLRRAFAFGSFIAFSRASGRMLESLTHNSAVPPFIQQQLESKQAFLRGLISCFVALKIDGSIHKKRLLLIWLLLRAVRTILPTTTGGPTLVMCLASSQVLTSWIFAPNEVYRPFLNFLNYHGANRVEDIRLFRESAPPLPNHCLVVHPGVSCNQHFPLFFLSGLAKALRLYVPLHLTFALLSNRFSFTHFVEQVTRSTMFLASYCAVAWYAACTFFGWFPGITRPKLMIPTFFAGLPTLFETPKRRVELAIYVSTYAIDSLINLVEVTRKTSVYLPTRSIFLACVATLFHNHDQLPSFLSHMLRL
eukprot:TRINITY_DN5784_c0_g1_i1.p1 TRINITY_DN5784_c0_g1~~TRINITY_DN5784_c0_g1_i1.p1  ORF type:complete len:366 (+),score=58.62 TRINITY_DN5784_c0_g1_i1:101-1198(+)